MSSMLAKVFGRGDPVTAMSAFEKVFGRAETVIIGAVHLHALPGTPRHCKTVQEIVDHAIKDVGTYLKHGMDGVIIENTHDVPYMKTDQIGPEITATVARVCTEVRRKFPKAAIGVQVLAGGNTNALAIAQATGLNFIRAEGFVYSAIADEGFMDACAGPLMRYRRQIGADDVLVFADIKKKHSSHAITGDLSIQDIAEAAEGFLADGVIISGKMTGKAPDPQEAAVTQKHVKIPVLFGSGVSNSNLHAFFNQCNGIIVGSDFKEDGKWYNEIEEKRVKAFMDNVKELRETIAKQEKVTDKKPTTTNFVG